MSEKHKPFYPMPTLKVASSVSTVTTSPHSGDTFVFASGPSSATNQVSWIQTTNQPTNQTNDPNAQKWKTIAYAR